MAYRWAPWATRSLVLTSTPRFTGSARKITMHSMECGTHRQRCCWPTYGYGSGTPHLSVCPETDQARQHIPFDRSARAMKSPGGGRSPNINSGLNIQVEVSAWARDLERYNDDWYRQLAWWLSRLCENLRIPKTFPFDVGYSSTRYRVDWPTWRDASGIVFHQNAPFNDHWDAPYDIDRLRQFMNVSAPEPDDSRTYTVERGDSLWTIAERLCGDGAQWRDIARASGLGGTVIRPGQGLTVPCAEKDPAPTPKPEPDTPMDMPYPWTRVRSVLGHDALFAYDLAANRLSTWDGVWNGTTAAGAPARPFIADLQRGMNSRGYSLAVDGRYGPKTESNVHYFQKNIAVHRDGRRMGSSGPCGPNTWWAIFNTPIK